MNSLWSGETTGDKRLDEYVNIAVQKLNMLGRFDSSVTANWRVVRDGSNRPAIVLDLSDLLGARVQTAFVPAELANEQHLSAKLYRIWGDLLQARSHKQLDLLSGNINITRL